MACNLALPDVGRTLPLAHLPLKSNASAMNLAHRVFYEDPTLLQVHESRIPATRNPGGVDVLLAHGMQPCKRLSDGTWQTVWVSTGSANLWPLWLSGPLGDDTNYFAYDFSTQGFGDLGLRPAEIASNLSIGLDFGEGSFQGASQIRLDGVPASGFRHYYMRKDPSCLQGLAGMTAATSLESNFMMNLAMEAVKDRCGAAETFAGFVFFGVPHRASKMVTLTLSCVMAEACKRCHKSEIGTKLARGSLLVLRARESFTCRPPLDGTLSVS